MQMPAIKILSESQLRELVKLDSDAIDCIEAAFATLAGGQVVMPPILSMDIAERHGEVDVKTAYVPGLDRFAIKVSPGFFDNPKRGLPSTSGLMVLHSSETGFVEAVLLDNGYLTAIRTAAAGAVAARYLSRPDSKTVCVVGAGLQARLQLTALTRVRPVEAAGIWSPFDGEAADTAAELGRSLGIAVTPIDDLAETLPAADIVVTTTPATRPIVKADWLSPGQHITAMGSDQPSKGELEPACLAKADRYVPDHQAQTAVQGELHQAIEAGLISAGARFPELGEVVSGRVPGRSSIKEITIADLTGMGVQDTAIANFAFQRALQRGVGEDFDN